ncbi:DUF1819 family protein [Antrihabitans cavernicola]|uniref:DUF1819 family protein n=1 Tax=Antrihabitans cavernicola TaxID=2495913 RepID=UPI001658ECFB|nr:DUF1819 family protein [Spelaeibacter cavernicola]
MRQPAYRLSFTTGGLLRAEAVAIAGIMLSSNDAAQARDRAIAQNVVQQRTTASTVRMTREVLQRLAELPEAGVELVAHGSVDDSRHALWLAACLRYRFLRDFGREVVRDRYVTGRSLVTSEDFDTFWNLQSSWVDALRDAADSTRNKLRQNTFRMLRDAGMLSANGQVLPVHPTAAVSEVIAASDPTLLLSFPANDARVGGLAGASNGAR